MSFLEEHVHAWKQRVSRYRRLSTLLGDADVEAHLRASTLEAEQLLERLQEAARQRQRDNAVLLAAIDALLAQMKAAMFFGNNSLRPNRYSAEDIGEASQLCREEAKACDDVAIRRLLASRALEFAFLGDQTDR